VLLDAVNSTGVIWNCPDPILFPHVALQPIIIHNERPVAYRHIGRKHYELSDHLGNVRVVVSDIKLSSLDVYNEPSDFTADVISRTDYYAYGSPMPGRSYADQEYRLGFNGMFKDDEIGGPGGSYTAEFWQYDSRIGRRWNIDPAFEQYPAESPYLVFHDNPIYYTDPYGDDPPEEALGPGDKVIFRIDFTRKGARRKINANSSGPVLTMTVSPLTIYSRQRSEVITGQATPNNPTSTQTFDVPPGGSIRYTQGHATADWGTSRSGRNFAHNGAFGYWGVKAGKNTSAAIGWTFDSDFTIVRRERRPLIDIWVPKFTWKGGGRSGGGTQSKVNRKKLQIFKRWKQRRNRITF
jgi:hypothetical protein